MTKTYHTSDIEILIATMNRNNFDFLKSMFVFSGFYNFNILIVNQTTEENILKSDFETVKVINVFDKGLSKSRNIAIQNSTKDILVFTDDDVVIDLNFSEKILKTFNKRNDYDGFRFRFKVESGGFSKKYPENFKQKLNWFEVLNASSIELVFKRESIFNIIAFDEDFGLGSLITLGEEAVFLADAKKKKLKIGFVPKTLIIHNNKTTSQKISNELKYFNQSAVFFRIFKNNYLFWVFLKLFFDLKQGNIAFSNVFTLLKEAIKGKNKYAEHIKL
ncbi:glycosyltransferase family A protein [Flavobacterium sp.]|uniref:glycosyltransferase family A protein n=1 Tax=Flavobacterium sp. TaxID=239 RepID=UPI003D2703A9